MSAPATDRPTGGLPAGSDGVRFVLDGEVHTVRDAHPETTVLNYLRDVLGRRGTKEGCAEGDCGACTVVLGEAQGERVRFRAVNSCIQLLPTLDGKALFTVESLKGPDGALHPVQRALVECHGSQCGFCTPGFVMSLFALYKSHPKPGRRDITDALAGNLCRCTGYRPIIASAERMYEYGRAPAAGAADPFAHPCAADAPPGPEERALAQRLRDLHRREALNLNGHYFAPASADELAALVSEHPEACLLAGGTDVGLWVTKEHRDLGTIIYLGNVAELHRVQVSEGHLEVGAAATLTDVMRAIADHYPDMGELYRRFGSPPIRNAATLAGNIANGSPIGDSMPGLISLGASVILRRGDARRELPLDAFYLDYRRTALEPGEFVEAVRVPLPTPGRHFRTYKVSKRFDQDISGVCAAFCLDLDGNERVLTARVCYGAMAATPKRAADCEAALTGETWSEPTVKAAIQALERDFAPITDMRASSEYRCSVARNLLWRFWLETSGSGARTRILEEHG
ncbi:MAG: xanthine dehydrogenase small subunit [Gammaproteobacteria bacterium]|nr:xanthine dehydrogenase small subunit [Gammaproteobacteria bacterium]NIR88825.1 xanthine dehydrogenase small subunit [Gammaproteobacteria bacterium]NIU06429.1 xanthine dehydrogenase small subunit [Gammaproteobacteria bacterium]NIV53321.1 xanthine dehydrogenase small subunit [Gammaproteobacteria bacterium]NIV74040.1 xanthine dehydrogenase small subunit [Gammaproteobacteria bacterium]